LLLSTIAFGDERKILLMRDSCWWQLGIFRIFCGNIFSTLELKLSCFGRFILFGIKTIVQIQCHLFPIIGCFGLFLYFVWGLIESLMKGET